MLALVLAVSVFPGVSTPPGFFRVTITVPRHEDNRVLYLIWGDDYGKIRESEIELNGGSPVQYTRELSRLPPGEYWYDVIVVRKKDGNESIQKASKGFTVVGG